MTGHNWMITGKNPVRNLTGRLLYLYLCGHAALTPNTMAPGASDYGMIHSVLISALAEQPGGYRLYPTAPGFFMLHRQTTCKFTITALLKDF